MCIHQPEALLPHVNDVNVEDKYTYSVDRMLAGISDMVFCPKCGKTGHYIKSNRRGIRWHDSNYFFDKANAIRERYKLPLLSIQNQEVMNHYNPLQNPTQLSVDSEGQISERPKILTYEAIWLEKALQTTLKRTVRITKGMMVRVEGGKLVDVNADNGKPATHLILECKGTIYSTDISIDLEDLVTGEESVIRL